MELNLFELKSNIQRAGRNSDSICALRNFLQSIKAYTECRRPPIASKPSIDLSNLIRARRALWSSGRKEPSFRNGLFKECDNAVIL